MPEDVLVNVCRLLPAVHHHGPRVRGIARLHPSQEGQEQGGVLGHPVVRPGRELELPHLPLLAGAVLEAESGGGVRLVVGLRLLTHLWGGVVVPTLNSANVLTQ